MPDTRTAFATRSRKLVKRYGRRTLRRISRFLDGRSLVPKQPFHDVSSFAWAADLEAATPIIQAELARLLAHRDSWPRVQELQNDQANIAGDGGWRSFVLYGWGHTSPLGMELCPETARIAQQVPGLTSAFFSFLGPRSQITEHKALDGSLLRYHLGLSVPKDRQQCALTLDGQRHVWEEGGSVVFDDTYLHSAHNDTDEERVVLLLHFERPMDWLGRAVHRLALALVKRTYYVRDAVANQHRFEKRFRRQLASVAAAAAPRGPDC